MEDDGKIDLWEVRSWYRDDDLLDDDWAMREEEQKLLDAIEAERLRIQLEAEAGIRQNLLNWGMGLLGEDPHSHVEEGNGFQFMDGERDPSSSRLQPLSLKRPSSPMAGERARFTEGDGLANGDEAWFEAERQRRVAAEEVAREREREEGELIRMRLEEREQREVMFEVELQGVLERRGNEIYRQVRC
jgi:hypothetical protein